jgi:RNA polymerase sigma-70 factor (ECF subfamily)
MVDLKKENVPDLLQRAGAGDRGCLEKLVNLFHGDIFRLIYYRVGSRMEAEDLTQDTFLEMTRSLVRLREPAKFKAWLYSIALNKVRDFHRKKRLRTFLFRTKWASETDDQQVGPLGQIMAKEFWREFHSLTDRMSPKEREIFMLRYVDQLGIREIADTMGRNESTVKTHLYRALKKFKDASGFQGLLEGSVS